MGRSDFPKFSATQIADLIKQADTKATSTLYVLGISTAALMARLTSLKSSGAITPMRGMLFALAGFLIVVAFKTIMSVIYPRLGKPKKGDALYFESIALETQANHTKRGMALSEEDELRALHANAWNLARVAHKKYHALRLALALTALSVVTTIAILVSI